MLGRFSPFRLRDKGRLRGAWITALKHFTLFKDPQPHRDCVCVCVCVCVCLLTPWIWFVEGRLPGCPSAPHKPPHNQEIIRGDGGTRRRRRRRREEGEPQGIHLQPCVWIRVRAGLRRRGGGRKERRGNGCLAQWQNTRAPDSTQPPSSPGQGSPGWIRGKTQISGTFCKHTDTWGLDPE